MSIAARSSAWPKPLREFAAAHETDDPRVAMATACLSLRERAREVTPPVGLGSMLDLVGAKTAYTRMQADAVLRRRDRGWLIELPEPSGRRAWRRERFTLAHELGHILLFDTLAEYPKATERLRQPGHWRAVESLCNFAAAELLMPREHIVGVLEREGFTAGTLGGLYETLLVSWRALLVRLGEILPRASVVTWRDHARPERDERRTLRVLRSYGGADGPWLPEGLTARYLEPDPVAQAVVRGDVAEPDVEIALSGRRRRVHTVAISTEHVRASNDPSLFRSAPAQGVPRPDADVVMLAIDSGAILGAGAVGAIWEASLKDGSERHGGLRGREEQTPTSSVDQLAFDLAE